jgi:hypothetical protein
MLHNIDEKNKGYTYISWWFNIFHNGLDTFGERLTLDNVVAKNEGTH